MPKEVPFDPCRQWLGIDAVDLGNARLVLGVAAGEADPLAVNRAADARLNLLRAIAPGPFELARASLVKRVEEAREKLLAEIAAGGTRPAPSTVAGFAMPAPPSQLASAAAGTPSFLGAPSPGPGLPPPVPGQPAWGGGDASGGGDGVGTIRIRTTVYRKKTPVAGIALALVALTAVAGGLAYYTFVVKGQRQLALRDGPKPKPVLPPKVDPKVAEPDPEQEERDRERQRQEREEREKRQREERQQRAREELERQQREREKQEQEKRAQQEREKQEREKKKQDSEKNQPQMNQGQVPQGQPGPLEDTLAEAFAALRSPDGGPDHDAVMRLLDAASGQARGAEDKKRVAAWRDLATFHKGFLDYRARALAAVKVGDEYDVKDRKIAVVEVDEEVFKYHENGRNKTVARAELPAGLALAIVTSWFDKKPANDLYLGAYHFAKQEPNPKLARDHWEKAEAGGADASALLPLLDDPVFTRAIAQE